MGTVHVGRLRGAAGFSRVVALKRLCFGLSEDVEFRRALVDEARLVSRIRHPNVVPALDVVEVGTDLYMVMEYVHGVSLASLLMHGGDAAVPVDIAVGILEGVLAGLHAAHEARGEDGTPLGIVHRDVSPENILVGADGIARLIDFGIAKAATRTALTQPGTIKGKVGYMAPEQLLSERISRHADIFAAAVVLWEALANRRLIEQQAEGAQSERPGALARRLAENEGTPPSRHRAEIGPALDAVVLRGLALEPTDRFPTAERMAISLREASPPATTADIAKWVHRVAGTDLDLSEERVRLLEQTDAEAPEIRSAAATRDSGPRAKIERSASGLPRKGAARIGAAILVGALLVLVLARATFLRPATADTPANLSIAAASEPAKDNSARSPPASAALLPPSAQPPSTSPSLPSPSSGASTRLRSVRPAGQLRRPPAKRPCDPPYTIDTAGRKHYDPMCF
jgi:serine/threonine-protein kinase